MPFPLAHPAAVLPFRRYCPRLLSLPALIVGSLIPDAGYLGKPINFDEVTHCFWGLFAVCLPAGIAVVLLFYAMRERLLTFIPKPFRRILAPVFQQPAASFQAVALSVFIGAATHLLWDSFTHEDGWLVGRLGFLHQPIMRVQGHAVRLCHVLGYGSTLAGVACLGVAYQRWRSIVRRSVVPLSPRVCWTNALLLGCLVVLAATMHHLIHGALDAFLSASLASLLMLGFVWQVERQFNERPEATAYRADGTSV